MIFVFCNSDNSALVVENCNERATAMESVRKWLCLSGLQLNTVSDGVLFEYFCGTKVTPSYMRILRTGTL
jgi:hypothetical protein